MINVLMSECSVIEAPPDASLHGQLIEHDHSFLSQRAMGDTKEDIVKGKPVRLEETCYFRTADLIAYLDRHNFREYKVNKITSILRQNGAEHHFFNVDGKGINCWKLDGVIAKTKPKPRLELPDAETPF